ncbi:MAG: GNAT family N-acetyltransferase [Prolixibacteraceae bacterium]|nr:GNAT family N-acetyltransferase [Prolixibacteraceae bacterium]
MKIRFHSPVIITRNFEKMKDFYCNVLQQSVKDGFGNCVTFENGLTIWQLKPEYPLAKLTGKCFSESGNNNLELCFETEDFEDTCNLIKSYAVKILHDKVEEAWGQFTIRFYDPENNLIELGESIPCFVKRLYKNGITPEEISKRTSVSPDQVISITGDQGKVILKDGDVKLRPLREDDKYRMAELANNEKISINLRDGFPYPYTIEDAENFIRTAMSNKPASIFAIEYGNVYVGNIGLHKESDVYRKSAELRYFIGEPYWNKGITTKAAKLICNYGFRELDIVRIHSGVFEYNHASQKVLEKCGFKKEGIMEKAVWKNGKLCNEIRYALLKNI